MAVAGASGEHKEGTTFARTRRIGDSYRNEPIDHCEVAGIWDVVGNQRGLAAVRPALAAIVGKSHAVRAVGALRLGHGRRPIAGVALRHGSVSGEGKGLANTVAMNLRMCLVISLPPYESCGSWLDERT